LITRPALAVFLQAILLAPSLLAAQPAADSAQRSLNYLRQVMDEYHTRFTVYDDVSSPGNHFPVYTKIADQFGAVEMSGSWTVGPHSGATAIRCELKPASAFGGFYFQNGTLTGTGGPQPNFGAIPHAGIDLTGATALTFWARGAVGNERVDFFTGGIGYDPATQAPTAPYPDSAPRAPAPGSLVTLSKDWQKFTIDLTGRPMNYVLAGFAWVADTTNNPGGAVFFLDDIQFELNTEARAKRLNEPRFLRSYTTLPLQPDPFDAVSDGDIDLVLRNLEYVYDNALALLAFVADGSADSLRRARLIGDAFVYAMKHDRTFDDNRACTEPIDPLSTNGARLRTAYAAGDISLPPGWAPKGRIGTVAIPSFYYEATNTFSEVEQQSVDVGNNAWAMVALEALYQKTGDATYRDGACKLGNFIHSFRNDSGAYQGFTGGVDQPEDVPTRRQWLSTEHNLDIYAAFNNFFRISGEPRWQSDFIHARAFVDAMWDSKRNCYLTGAQDPATRNETPGQLPLDVQAWSILAIPDAATTTPAIICAETNHLNTHDGITGFDFNEDRDGVWLEGTAQMTTAYAFAGRAASADFYRAELQHAQQTLGDGEGLPAASHDGLTTGFGFQYFRRLHAGATAWNVFAQLGYDPYYAWRMPIRRRAVAH
jgi:hypothetical protein